MEVMVALAIMAVALVAVFQVYSIGLRSAKKADDYTKAVLYARAALDEAYAIPDPSEAAGTKEMEKLYSIKTEVVLKSSSEDNKTKLYEIQVTVAWPPSGSLIIKGLRSFNESKG